MSALPSNQPTPTPRRRRRRWLPHPVLSLFMLVFWLLLANQISGGHLLLGALLGWLIPYVTQSFWPQQMSLSRPWVALRFFIMVVGDIIVANFNVARLILGPTRQLRPAFMRLDLDLTQDFSITLLASTVSLTPGTVSADLTADGKALIIHSLDVDDPAEAIAIIKRRYEAPLKEIFECSIP